MPGRKLLYFDPCLKNGFLYLPPTEAKLDTGLVWRLFRLSIYGGILNLTKYRNVNMMLRTSHGWDEYEKKQKSRNLIK